MNRTKSFRCKLQWRHTEVHTWGEQEKKERADHHEISVNESMNHVAGEALKVPIKSAHQTLNWTSNFLPKLFEIFFLNLIF